MNRKLFSMALLAGMTLFAACSDDETTNNGDNNGIADGTTLSGTVTEDVTLKSGNTYKLSGAYTVEEGATLNIEPGVKIISVYDDNVDYILVKQGAKINAKKPVPGVASTSVAAPIPMPKAVREALKSAVPNMEATTTRTTQERCNTYAWSTQVMLSMKNTKPTASASMA